jgi:endonuclease YncB( thermonuclease family)
LVGGKLTACGKSARDALAALVVGKRVVCTRIASRGSDRFGRTIASCVVYAPDSGDFELSTYMAETGLAALADETQGLDPAYLHRIETDIQNAQSGTPKKGIWAGCMIKPERWRLQNNEGAQIRDGFVLGRWDPDNVIDPKACGR